MTIEHFEPLPELTHHHVFGLDRLPERCMDVTALPAREVEPGLTLFGVMYDYLHEHAIPSTADARRASQGAWEWVKVLGPDFPVEKITRSDGRKVIEALRLRGLKPGSVKRVMSVGIAALHHAKKEGRLKEVPKFPKVAAGEPRVRWLSREEHRRIMNAPKPPRLHRFYVIAFATGARSEAIEQLTWDRVDFRNRTIDFRIPGKDHKNKRRAVVPISDSLLVRLEAMHAKRTDEYVIGAGPSGRPTTTYHHAKQLLRELGIDEHGVARHVARHTVASWMLQGDKERGIPPAPIQHVARMLGDTVAMIDKTYGHLSQEHLREASRMLP